MATTIHKHRTVREREALRHTGKLPVGTYYYAISFSERPGRYFYFAYLYEEGAKTVAAKFEANGLPDAGNFVDAHRKAMLSAYRGEGKPVDTQQGNHASPPAGAR